MQPYKKVRCACGILKSWDVFISMQRGRAWKKRARRTATASLPLWARIPRFYIWNNELERAKDAICERPLNLYVCRRGALWLAYHRTQTQSATQWEFVFNPSTDIDSDYSYDTRTRQKCFIRTGYSFQPSIRLNSNPERSDYRTLRVERATCFNPLQALITSPSTDWMHLVFPSFKTYSS